MAGYELRIAAAAAKEIDALPRAKDRRAVIARIQALAGEPRPPGSVKLSGLEELYRVRQGRYRIVYEIEDDSLTIVVVRVADRKEVYRQGRQSRSLQRTRPFKPGGSEGRR